MRILLLAVATFALTGAALGAASAQAPTEDSVVGSGTAADPSILYGFDFDARSGPSGENATGTASIEVIDVPFLRLAGPVTCLNVAGNRAVIGIENSLGNPDLGRSLLLDVTDATPDLVGLIFPAAAAPPATVCPAPGIQPRPDGVVSGDLVVTDAQPFPTSKDQCKNGGWRNYGTSFKNQGQCVAFVVRRGCPVQRGTIAYRDPYCANPIRRSLG